MNRIPNAQPAAPSHAASAAHRGLQSASASVAAGILLIVGLTFLAYVPALDGGFIWDDDAYVTENRLLTDSDGWRRIWFSTHQQSQYFPLVYTTLRLERMLWGLNPTGYHVVNVVFHCANALLVWLLLRYFLRSNLAWFAAAIFALHPVQVESVAWISELKNTQSTFFYLLALLCWMRFLTAERLPSGRMFYCAALLFAAFALLSKTTTCTLPVAFLLVGWIRREPLKLRRILQLLPFFALSLGMGLLTIWWESHLNRSQAEWYGASLSFLERLLIAGRAVFFYAEKLFWPANLAFSYPRWDINPRVASQYLWLAASLGVSMLLWWRRNSPERGVAAAVLFFVVTLAPLLGFIPLYTFRYTFVADHYQYVACIGLIAIAVAALGRLGEALGASRNVRGVAALGLLTLLGTLTWLQARTYSNSEILWRSTLKRNPSSWMAHNNLGMALVARGDLDASAQHYRESLRINPANIEAWINLGSVLRLRGDHAAAAEHFRRALQIDPRYAPAHNHLGVILVELGRTDDAIAHYEEALRLAPRFPAAFCNLGRALALQGRLDEAVAMNRRALEIDPGFLDALNSLGALLGARGEHDEAIQLLRKAVRLSPNYVIAHRNLVQAFVAVGDLDQALAHSGEAIQLAPDNPAARLERSQLLARIGRLDEAVAECLVALQLNPGNPEARTWLESLDQAISLRHESSQPAASSP